MRALSLLAPPFCAACRMPVARRAVLCGPCRSAVGHLPAHAISLAGLEVWAPVRYEGPARAVVRGLKFAGALALADHMAAAIAARAPTGLLAAPLVPVPSPPDRRRRRGFCHAELLAAALGRRSGLPIMAPLMRQDARVRQVGRARAERLRAPPRFRALRGGFGPVVLVDDVVTTGATVRAASESLREAGWHCGRAVAYARTPVR